jgi:hypothetical protein
MVSLKQKSVLSAMLSLALLILGGVNLFSVSVDNDGDDDTPPITVEFSFLGSSKRAIQSEKNESLDSKIHSAQHELSQNEPASLDNQAFSGFLPTSSPIVVPLRT